MPKKTMTKKWLAIPKKTKKSKKKLVKKNN
jgi:hypothetical protein